MMSTRRGGVPRWLGRCVLLALLFLLRPEFARAQIQWTPPWPPPPPPAHERVHILQYDQSFLSLGEPIDAWIGRAIPDLGTPFNLEFNVAPLTAALLLVYHYWPGHGSQPWEREAMFMGRLR